MEKLLRALESFTPWNEQEEKDRAEIIRQIKNAPDILTRANHNAHISASAWVVDSTGSRVLMVYHNLYHSWSWPGGHADGDADLLSVALREVEEECGVKARPVTEDIFSVEILTVDGHEKKGEYVSSHLHLNITYLLQADETAPIREKPDENSGVRWFLLDEALNACTEPWMIKRIYSKLNDKLRASMGEF